MADYREAFVGIDVAKLRNAVAKRTQAATGRFAFSVRSMLRPPTCAASLGGSPTALTVSTSVTKPARLAMVFIA